MPTTKGIKIFQTVTHRLMSRLWQLLAYPLTKGWPLFLTLVFMRMCYVFVMQVKSSMFFIGPFIVVSANSYAATMLAGAFHRWRWVRRSYVSLVLIVFFILSVCELGVAASYGRFISINDVAILAQTDSSEMHEFLSVYFKPEDVLALLLFAMLCVGVWILSRRLIRRHCLTKPGRDFCISLMLVFNILALATGTYFKYGIDAVIACVDGLRNIPPLNTTEKVIVPEKVVEAPSPRLVVLFVGESLDRKHMSSLGYDKITTPRIDSLLNSYSGIILFPNAFSAATHTIDSFKWIFSDISDPAELDDSWRYHVMLPTAIHNAGYRTYYISTAHKYGFFSKIPTRISELCDSVAFLSLLNDNGKVYDEMLLDPMQEIVDKMHGDSLRRLVVINSLGQHVDYAQRFTEEFACFCPTDYADRPEYQRKDLSDYDNSVRYTDNVVASIIDILSDEDAVMIFTSDHGQDIFVSSEDYAGHGIEGNHVSEVASSEVPFIVWVSPRLAERFPAMIEVASAYRNQHVVMKGLMFTILDLIGYDTPCREVATRSIFRGDMLRALRAGKGRFQVSVKPSGADNSLIR